jgi:hypothetical protein
MMDVSQRVCRHVFWICEGLCQSVVDSQIIEYIAHFQERGLIFDLLCTCDGREYFETQERSKRKMKVLRQRLKGRVICIPVPWKAFAAGAVLGAGLFGLLYWRQLLHKNHRLIIHARGDQAAFMASLVKRCFGDRIFITWDVRGDTAHETRFLIEQGVLAKSTLRCLPVMRRRYETIGLRANCVNFVSSPLEKEFRRNIRGNARTVITPCCGNGERFFFDQETRVRMRDKLGLKSALVLIFSGKLGLWHYSEEISGFVSRIAVQCSALHFLLLTQDIDAAKGLIARHHLTERTTILSVPHDQVASYICAADFGLLLRAEHPLNKVAAPTKFAEYVMCGLPVLISPGIGEYSDFVRSNDAGLVIDWSEESSAQTVGRFLRFAQSWTVEERVRLERLGGVMFSLTERLETLVNIYKSEQ